MVGNERVLLADQPRKSGSFPRLDLTCCGQYQYQYDSGSWSQLRLEIAGLAGFNVGKVGVGVRDCLSSMCRQALVAEPFSSVPQGAYSIPCHHAFVTSPLISSPARTSTFGALLHFDQAFGCFL